jgi:hypothetical protein
MADRLVPGREAQGRKADQLVQDLKAGRAGPNPKAGQVDRIRGGLENLEIEDLVNDRKNVMIGPVTEEIRITAGSNSAQNLPRQLNQWQRRKKKKPKILNLL